MSSTKALHWYNKLSLIHDVLSFRDWPYRNTRKQAINALDLQQGDTVIDLFCGTGINFKPILKQIGEHGQLIGIDGSKGMLAHAHSRIQKLGWNPKQIKLIEKNLLNLTPNAFDSILPSKCTPKVLITLALGIFPNYGEVFTNIFSIMPVGTRFVIMEGYCERGARGAWLINLIGHSDCHRPVWEPVKALTSEYHEAWYTPDFKYIKGSLIVATGVKGK